MSILTKDQNGNDVLKLFDTGITIDQKLPKWVNAAKTIKERKEEVSAPKNEEQHVVFRETRYDTNTGTQTTNMPTEFTIYTTPEHYEVQDSVSFDDVAAANLKELTILIKKGELNNILSGYGGMNGHLLSNNNNWVYNAPSNGLSTSATPIKRLINKAKSWLNSKLDKKPEFDAVEFFTNVKLASKDGAIVYRDRVASYLQAIHNANMVGQTALLEQLLSEMIANKYEAMLNSHGCYYAISEKRMVDFANKTERGVDLCYLKNFVRPIPQEAIDKIKEVNEYEVFDNYVVLHYDPKGENKKETKREEAKRKDPILFGVIAGSRKLYYITDWVDKVCDLTLESFVDALGTTKSEFLVGEDPNAEPPKDESKTEEKPAKKKPRKKSKKE